VSRVNSGHVTSDNQVEISSLICECRFYSRHRPRVQAQIRQAAVRQHTIAFRWAKQRDISGSSPDSVRHLLYKASRTPGKEGFVTPHPRAISANQYKSGGIHAQIVAPASLFPGIMRSNNLALARYVFPKLGQSSFRREYPAKGLSSGSFEAASSEQPLS
jgi:hypothetical protein